MGFNVTWARGGLAALALLAPATGFANSEGPPWGNAGGPGQDNCTTCHFDGEAVTPSQALTLTGLGSGIKPGTSYDATLSLRNAEAVRAGFQILANGTKADGSGAPAGRFEPVDEKTEANGSQIRSNINGSRPEDPDAVSWQFRYTLPAAAEDLKSVTFYMAANAGNDDESPFGDTVHLKTAAVPVSAE